LDCIKRKIQPQSFHTWFGATSCRHLSEDEAGIEVPNAFFSDWLEENYSWLILAAVEEVTRWKPRLAFYVRNGSQGTAAPASGEEGPQDTPEEAVKAAENGPGAAMRLHPEYRFGCFVLGQSNEFAVTAARAVAERPGKTAFNPLFLFGGVGLGKTHLLHAIGHACQETHTAKKVVYATAERFISDYMAGIRRQDTSKFVLTYRHADVLLIDDIQFYAQTEGCQREFVHTFNALHQEGKQIVICSDRPPSSLKGFEDRLLSRFQWGLVTDIGTPDLETRIAIVQQKAAGQNLPDDVAEFIAARISTNIRELEGALTRVLAYSKFRCVPVDLTLAADALDRLGYSEPARRRLNICEIQKMTADFFDVAVDSLLGPTRKQKVAQARHVSMFLAKKLIGAPLKAIGSETGNRDHSTVIHACRSIERKLASDPEFGGMVVQLEEQLQSRAIG
jgi:chromosomal replication initiator protein